MGRIIPGPVRQNSRRTSKWMGNIMSRPGKPPKHHSRHRQNQPEPPKPQCSETLDEWLRRKDAYRSSVMRKWTEPKWKSGTTNETPKYKKYLKDKMAAWGRMQGNKKPTNGKDISR